MTLDDLEDEILELHRKRDALVPARTLAQESLATATQKIRTSGYMPDQQYRALCHQQSVAKREIKAHELALVPIRDRLRELSIEVTKRKRESGRQGATETKTETLELARAAKDFNRRLLDLRQHYLDFAKDATRVASTRRMASEFVDALTVILREVSSQDDGVRRRS